MNEDKTDEVHRTHPQPLPASEVDAPHPGPLLISLSEAATLLGVSRWSVYLLINRGELAAVRIRSRRLIAATELTAYIQRIQAEGALDAA